MYKRMTSAVAGRGAGEDEVSGERLGCKYRKAWSGKSSVVGGVQAGQMHVAD